MRDELAERLLQHALDWDIPTAKEEIGKLRYLSAVKYDTYRNFEPGKRFMESLVLWLRQFDSTHERKVAYEFVTTRLLYISETQMDHLIDLLYPQRVLPILLEQAIAQQGNGMALYRTRSIRNSEAFRVLHRKTLFLGMSDGARIDAFRRKHSLSNEQISVSYELSEEKSNGMHKDLKQWLAEQEIESEATFENVFLIDDFTGSGNTILREKQNAFRGRLAKFINTYLGTVEKPGNIGRWCVKGGPRVFVVTYLGTETAMECIKQNKAKLVQSNDELNLASCEILSPLQVFDDRIKVPQTGNLADEQFIRLLDSYYDTRLEDQHTRTGGNDVKYGYAGCALPLVLCHNCPNNSVYLLWGTTEKTSEKRGVKALFPRIARHLEGR